MADFLYTQDASSGKLCPRCNTPILRRDDDAPSTFARRKYCSNHCARKMAAARPAHERFEKKVDRTAGHGPNGDCHIWTAHLNQNGYGTFAMWGKSDLAHRVAYFLSTGAHPQDRHVCHSCDNPACVNPAHLWLGDHSANMTDMVKKGRGNRPKGMSHTSAKLTENDVREIRASSETTAALARKFGVAENAIASIRNGRTWRSVI